MEEINDSLNRYGKSTSNTKWVEADEMPRPGEQCPVCGQDYLVASKYGGVWCPKCHTRWKITKFPKKKTETEIKSDDIKLIVNGLGVIRGDIKKMKEELITQINERVGDLIIELKPENKQQDKSLIDDKDIPIVD